MTALGIAERVPRIAERVPRIAYWMLLAVLAGAGARYALVTFRWSCQPSYRCSSCVHGMPLSLKSDITPPPSVQRFRC